MKNTRTKVKKPASKRTRRPGRPAADPDMGGVRGKGRTTVSSALHLHNNLPEHEALIIN